ncbi:alcohol dehydrogenase catalytic domain-containing protein [Micromonospora carbonacea]|uniref:alcohol dehydrogenase catalytic domain-containing protein n=1 Tax=Micromonospora carbonacea TaxID=47853 RepID=UPI003D762341
MRGVVYRGPRHVEVVDDLPMPRLESERDAVVRVTRAAICGSDLHPYRGEMPGFAPGTVLGHEFAGVVTERGSQVPFAVGERVVASYLIGCGRCPRCARGWHYHCPSATLFGYSTVVGDAVAGGQAEYVRVPFADVVLGPVPAAVTDEQALFAGDVLATAHAAVTDAHVGPGRLVGVVGAGPVGLMAALCAAELGATVVVCDVDPARRDRAGALVPAVVEPERLAATMQRMRGRDEAAIVIEAVGSGAALACAVDAAGPHGTVLVVGAHGSDDVAFPAGRAFVQELTLRFAVGNPIRSRDPVMALLRAGRVDPSALVSHRLPLAEAARGYELFDTRVADKVILLPSADPF